MTGNVQYVIDTAGDPPVAIFIATRAIARTVGPRISREVGLHEALVIAENRAHLTGPAILDDQISAAHTLNLVALVIHQSRDDAEERKGCRSWLQVHGTGQRRNEDAAIFGLPPCVDDRATAAADNAVIPFPGFGVDRLTH